MRRNVLIVDDDPGVLEGIQRALCDEPYRILTARSGLEALAILHEKRVDVVVADYHMGGIDGTKFLAKVRAGHPNTIRIMLTGKATIEVVVEAINKGGISYFLVKPCDPEELTLAIHQALIQNNLNDEASELRGNENKEITALDKVERRNPGITHLRVDTRGTINIEESTVALDAQTQ